ncbi:hutH: histidine ammonia-lyase [Gaiella occulta]|uniref:Histidine ammonia-lyase n=1 Tax=Gaiella occulta TaxID=1002870 RepID=A0A7M2YY77_9ACTN|nr:histidine ammonia-lyase [Gaiella occulta]RDI75036.1 hutH: histidine ammonia-lyase [Gaiella occulta]
MDDALLLTGDDLTVDDVWDVAVGGRAVALSATAKEKMTASRALLEESRGEHTYGVNTGFGRFVSESIPDDQAEELQLRLLRSHACGVGAPYPDEVVRAAMLLRANALAKGYSGARVTTVELLLAILDAGVVPYVPARGSVGASGDLAPLAHLALPLVGEGEAWVGGERVPGAEALARAGLEPVRLAAKEGLSLVNGTQFMTAMAALGLVRGRRLAIAADIACSMSLEALQGSLASFEEAIHRARPHPGQLASAANVRRLLEGSAIIESHRWCDKVQDAYSLRCAPQVHGASRDLLDYVGRTVAVEINAATDNPLVLLDEGTIVSNGNFHGQPVAFALDCLAIAVAELASISERRVERMVNPSLSDGLPAFLTREGGINSGFMILQYVSAALVSENKALAHPASVDSIPTSAGQEDHVSMGNAAGLKALQVLANAEASLAIELLAGAQAVEFLAPLEPGRGVACARAFVRTLSQRLREDRSLSADIERMAAALRDGSLAAAVESEIGALG